MAKMKIKKEQPDFKAELIVYVFRIPARSDHAIHQFHCAIYKHERVCGGEEEWTTASIADECICHLRYRFAYIYIGLMNWIRWNIERSWRT